MGLRYLNHAAVLKCVHGGTVQLLPPPRRSMYVQQSPVLTDRDLLSAVIIGCPQIGPGLKPCTKVVAIIMGRSRDIQVDGETPILITLKAMTDGVAPGMVMALHDGQSNAQTEAGEAAVESEDDERKRLEMLRDALDLVGIVDPTPVSDGASALISLKLGDWLGAGLSVISMVPYVGDLIAKPIKALLRFGKKIAEGVKRAAGAVKRLAKKAVAKRIAKFRAGRKMKKLADEGHGPQRHGPELTDQQLDERARLKHDPETGTRTDKYTGENHRSGDHATKVNSEESYVKGDDHLRGSDELKQGAANGDHRVTVEKPLEEIYGPGYRGEVSGRSRTAPWPDTTSPTRPTDFENGTMVGVYERTGDGGYRLVTMYPKPQ